MLWAARMGYMSRGLVYALVAYFAVLAAWGTGALLDEHGALTIVSRAPYGELLLWTTCAGLAAFVGWRLLQVFADVDRHGRSAKGWAIRLALLVSATLYGSLAYWTARLVLGDPTKSTPSGVWVARLLSQPQGRWMVAAVALVLAIVGFAHFHKAWRRGFLKYWTLDAGRDAVIRISQAGLVARGVLFICFAYFATRAAWHADADESKNLSQVLHWLQTLPWASLWVALVAAGLAAFAVYCMLAGWYRKVAGSPVSKAAGS